LAREQRRLAAIVSADVAGYSRLMGRDESGTLAALKALRREVIDPPIAAHGGRIVKTTGDGLLLEFPSVVDATRCMVEVQTAMLARGGDIAFRIGLHVGDVIIDDDDIFGDGVNIAARLQEIASPGGICISSRVHDDVQGRFDVAFEDVGAQSLKNIARPVTVWRWSPGVAPPAAMPKLALPDKPSIAVLPFQNMSGDPEQEYFADGMVEDIITSLSRFKSLFVIARNSSFTYKGKAVDIRQVGRELGVRYVLEGSVRKAGNRVRITGQLIQTDTGAHIWADRFDGDVTDIFDLQDKVTMDVVGAITFKLEHAEMERSRRKPTDNYGAYDCYLRALAIFYHGKKADLKDARSLCYRGIELDAGFAAAHALAALTHSRAKGFGAIPDESAVAETARLAGRAVELDRDDPVVLSTAGWALAYVVYDLDVASGLVGRAITLNPNLAVGWFASGQINVWLGQADLGIEHFARSMRLSPLDPQMGAIRAYCANAHFLAGRYDEAVSLMSRVLQEWQSPVAYRFAAASAAMAGRLEEARRFIELLLGVDPSRRVSNLKSIVGPYKRPEDIDRIIEGLRLAGLPE
jgi:TolB-like protein/class 3 adenylate cyclase/tetratricopeptide (TPR) repeat protein